MRGDCQKTVKRGEVGGFCKWGCGWDSPFLDARDFAWMPALFGLFDSEQVREFRCQFAHNPLFLAQSRSVAVLL